MKGKRACLVINPHAGQNVTRLTDLVAVLSAGGWRTEIVLKEYGGQSMELATRAAKDNCDLVIGYGGDGTLSQVLNGVMNAKGCRSIVGVIPGGTVNVWAAEIGVPNDPVQAALTLCNSEAHKVDIGHVEVQGLTFPGTAQDDHVGPRWSEALGAHFNTSAKKDKKARKREAKAASKTRHHFLLMAGFGIDAAVMEHASKSLKYRVGRLAVGLSAVEELPTQAFHPFPVEIRVGATKNEGEKIWKGKAFQVFVGNTRRIGLPVQMTPGAYIDDGLLDVCVITADGVLRTLEQIASLVFRHKPDHISTERFRGASITISVPASIDLELDGSPVHLKDYLSKSDQQALQSAEDAHQVMVTYRFEAMPRALRVAIPSTYSGALFEHPLAEEKLPAASQQHKNEDTAVGALSEAKRSAKPAKRSGASINNSFAPTAPIDEMQHEPPELIRTLLEQGHKVTVRGVASQLGKQSKYIIAGTVHHHITGDMMPVAVQVNNGVTVLRHTGEQVASALVQELQEGVVIVAEGKKSKYGVIRATHLLI